MTSSTKDMYMKKSPGKRRLAYLLIFAVSTFLSAGDFSYKFTLDKTTPYVKEAVILRLDLKQTDHSKVLLFKFSPRESDDYEFHRLDMKEENAYHNANIHYLYLIYPKHAGEIDISFKLLEMVTSDEKVAYSFSGDRDNVRELNKKDIPVDLPPLKLHVKALPPGTELTGNFKLNYTIKKEQVEAYEPLPLKITIEGRGYPPVFDRLVARDEHFSIFSEKPTIHTVRNREGSQSRITYSMALSAKKSFTFPGVTLRAFDPKTEKSYKLTIPPKHIEVKKVAESALVDKIDSPRPLRSDWSWLSGLLTCLLAFVAGFLSARSITWRPRKRVAESGNRWLEELAKIDDPKKVLTLLIAANDRRFEASIVKLEKRIYEKSGPSLGQIKSEISKIISEEKL